MQAICNWLPEPGWQRFAMWVIAWLAIFTLVFVATLCLAPDLPLVHVLLVALGVGIIVDLLAAIFTGLCSSRPFRGNGRTDEFKEALWNRGVLVNEPNTTIAIDVRLQREDRVLGYADRAIDRQINKARGILPFNSIIIATLALEKNRGRLTRSDLDWWISVLYDLNFFLIFLALAVSSYWCLQLFRMHVAAAKTYETFSAEFENTLKLLNERAWRVEFATIFSEACLFATITFALMTEITVWYLPSLPLAVTIAK